MKLAPINKAKPINYGFLPKLSESGPKTKGPNPSPRKIIVMSNWLSTTFVVPIETPQCLVPVIYVIANATTDINEAIQTQIEF
jgi:hypothetical protein